MMEQQHLRWIYNFLSEEIKCTEDKAIIEYLKRRRTEIDNQLRRINHILAETHQYNFIKDMFK